MKREDLNFIPIGRVKNNLIGQRFGSLTVIGRVKNEGKGRDVVYGCICDCGEYTKALAQNLTINHTTSCGCAKSPNLVGKRFGKLLVIDKKDKTDSKAPNIYICQCDCGNIREVEATHLIQNEIVSCGCLNKYYKNDITGQRFGKLVALFPIETKITDSGKHRSVWFCKCDCGNTKEATLDGLIQGHTKSCGCLRHLKGEEHFNYKQELTEEDRQNKRISEGYKEWQQQVKEKANFTCEKCGTRGGTLHSHHKDGYNWCKGRRTDISNGACLCESCHREFHKIYGQGDNTEEQYKKFLKR